jgi:hypothetical protein
MIRIRSSFSSIPCSVGLQLYTGHNSAAAFQPDLPEFLSLKKIGFAPVTPFYKVLVPHPGRISEIFKF